MANPPTSPSTATSSDEWRTASRQQAAVTSTIRPNTSGMPMRPYRTWAAQNAAYRITTPAPEIPSAVCR